MHGASVKQRRIFERALAGEPAAERGLLERYRSAWRALFPAEREHTGAGFVRRQEQDDLFDRAIRSAIGREPEWTSRPAPMRRWSRRTPAELARRLEAPRSGGYRTSSRAPKLRARYEPSWGSHVCFALKTFDRVAIPVRVARGAWLSGGELWVKAGGDIRSAELRHVRVGGFRGPGLDLCPHPLEDFEWVGLYVGDGAPYVVPGDSELARALRAHLASPSSYDFT